MTRRRLFALILLVGVLLAATAVRATPVTVGVRFAVPMMDIPMIPQASIPVYPFELQLYDQSHNPIAEAGRVITLSGPPGVYFRKAQTGQDVTTLTTNAQGVAKGWFLVWPLHAGDLEVTASAPGLTAHTAIVRVVRYVPATVTPAVYKDNVRIVRADVTAGTVLEVRAQVKDRNGVVLTDRAPYLRSAIEGVRGIVAGPWTWNGETYSQLLTLRSPVSSGTLTVRITDPACYVCSPVTAATSAILKVTSEGRTVPVPVVRPVR